VTPANVGDFLHRLTRAMAAELLGVESDNQLVERVLATRDETALLTIVLRHGTMVYHVCRRVLRHPQDAEDAFQATFLVLAQELQALRQHSSLAGWLHGVALRVSRKAKARSIAQQRREAGAARPEAVPQDDLTWSEVRSTLDGELSCLPDKWRLPLVLCYLEGQTQEEEADQLGWSKSTLRRRLEQARTALGSRLKRRGIAWSGVLPAVLASDSLTATAMSLSCVDSTIVAALEVVNGKSLALAASAQVAVLTEGVLKNHVRKENRDCRRGADRTHPGDGGDRWTFLRCPCSAGGSPAGERHPGTGGGRGRFGSPGGIGFPAGKNFRAGRGTRTEEGRAEEERARA